MHRHRSFPRLIHHAAPTLLAVVLSACAAGPDFARPAVPSATRYDTTPPPASVAQADTAPDNWWEAFGSNSLNRMVDEALRNSPGVSSAEAALRQSEAERRAGVGLYFPDLSLGASAQRELNAPQRLGLASAGNIFNLYTLGATIAYSVDLFGANRRTVEALTAGVESARYRRDAARLALTSNVVGAAIAHTAYQEQIAATQRLAAAQSQQLELLAAQVAAGVLPKTVELTSRGQLDATRATLPQLQQRAEASRHLLAFLAGREPSADTSAWPCWAEWHGPAQLPLTLPSTLVRQRPDILAAEAELHVATANVGVATANLLPSVMLGATGGWAANAASKLGSTSGHYWSAGPSFDLPLFAGGANLARRDSASAARDAAEASYRQTMLAAFAQVADVLSSIQRHGEAAHARDDALRASEQGLAIAAALRTAGTASTYDYLGAQIALESARIQVIDAEAQRLQDAVALFAALGGGWRPEEHKERP